MIVVLQGSAGGIPAGYKPAKAAGEHERNLIYEFFPLSI